MTGIRYSRGITLLEVLVSMGLLAIGLLTTLALFPAGGTYLRNADIDDRAAALIPSAFHTMRAQGLFMQDALYWQNQSPRSDTDHENTVIGFPHQPSNLETEAPNTATIREHYSTFDDPPTISGIAAPGEVVTITASEPTGSTRQFTVSADDTTGAFALTLSRDDLSVGGGFMTIHTNDQSGTMGEPKDYFDDWMFSAHFGTPPNQTAVGGLTITGPTSPPRLGNEPSAPTFRQYRKRRKVGTFEGPAKLDYTLPGITSTGTGSSSATLLNTFPPRGQLRDPYGRVLFARESQLTVNGELWRYQTGRKRGVYSEWMDFSDTNPPQHVTFQNPRYRTPPGSGPWQNASWENKTPDCPDDLKEDIADWFKFNVKKGELVTITPSDDTLTHRNLSFDVSVARCQRLLPLYLNGDTDDHVLEPLEGSGSTFTYVIPEDGVAFTRMNLMKVGTGGPNNDGLDENYNIISPDSFTEHRINCTPAYVFDISIVGNTRVAAIDPLMVSHLDRIINNVQPHPLEDVQKYFATFQQTGRAERTLIPRMTWKYLSDNRTFGQSVALAERLCRPFDTLDVLVPTDEVLSPEPIFETVDSGGVSRPTMRRSVGRMSWLVTIQPENSGSIELNWRSGNFFDVAIVVIENRLMPPLGATAIEGESVFGDDSGELVTWNPSTGLINIPISSDRGIDPDDLKRMFRPGAWLMLAPKVFDDNQTIDWLEIQTCEFEGQLDGSTMAYVLPTREPNTDQKNPPDDPDPLVVIAPQGVVAVARRSVRIE